MLGARGAASKSELLSWVVRMWGKQRSAEEASAGGVQSVGSVGRALGGADLNGTSPPGASARSGHAEPIQPTPAPTQRAGSDSATQAEIANGAPAAPLAAATNATTQGPTAQEVAFALTFTRIVSILMRSPHYKHYSLSELEWLVVAPVFAGQWAVMEAKINGRQVPVAVALWASVSEEVDKRLSENLTAPLKLRPDEWRSGEILWLIDAVGDAKAVPDLLGKVQETVFKGRKVRMRTLGVDSRPIVGMLMGAPSK